MKKNIKRLILGIDISTTCIGLSIVSCDDNDDTKLLYISHVKPKINSKKIKGTEALFAKSRVFKEQFLNLCNHLGIQNLITDIVIEEPLPGSQNVSTVNTLLKFNGMISEAVYELTGIVPIYISSYEARKYAFPELMAVRKYNKKGEEYCYNKIKNSIISPLYSSIFVCSSSFSSIIGFFSIINPCDCKYSNKYSDGLFLIILPSGVF